MIRNLVARVVSIREALEVGDVGLAYAIAADLEDEIVGGRIADRVQCDGCGRGFSWPGLLDRHHLSGACPAWREAA